MEKDLSTHSGLTNLAQMMGGDGDQLIDSLVDCTTIT